jgi:UDP-N-acetylglucosamine--N-acetylmuramyl-(pentapeptide) pyrophosphoryl-undecaprenol N-acetylglucosamine transferase
MSPNPQAAPPPERPLTIVLTGGGSGGHITPLLSLAHALKDKQKKVRLIFIGLSGEKVEGLEDRYQVFDEVYNVSSGKFRRYHGERLIRQALDFKTLFLNVRDLFKVLRGVSQAKKILKKVKPGVVFSKGGFVTVPVGIAANHFKVPIVTHDSDAVPGLANRIVGKWAVAHATGMPIDNYAYKKERTYYTGVPIDERIKTLSQADQERFKADLGIPPSSQVLLVGGAGLGSKAINDSIIEIAPRLLKQNPKLFIIHLTGQTHEEEVSDKYKIKLTDEELKRLKVLGFTADFYKYTGAADLVVTRAGATTIAELAVQKKPTILIPAAFLAAGHQAKNAEVLERAGAAIVISSNAPAEKLLAAINDLLNDATKRLQLAEKIGLRAKANAASELADLVLDVAARKLA